MIRPDCEPLDDAQADTEMEIQCFLDAADELAALWEVEREVIIGALAIEPPRVCRRPQLLRGWGYDEQDDEQVLA